jgi:NTE family protein
MERRRRAVLALGSGGARGYAHIGAIEVLEERGIEIVAVAGASMGAVVGGLYAAGKLEGYSDWVRSLTQFDLLRLLDVSVSAPGVIRAEKIFARVRELVDSAQIEDLSASFTAVATDLFARKAVWFQRGPVDVALRASMAIPGVFTPVMLNGRLLVDGGLMDPVPIAPTISSLADVTIAIDLGGERGASAGGVPALESAEQQPVGEWGERFRRGASRLLDRDLFRSVMGRMGAAPFWPPMGAELPLGADDALGSLPAGLSKFEVMNQSLDTVQSMLTRYRLAGNPPDILITIPHDACRALDFHRASEMIELGRAMTADALDNAGLESSPP